ncbi:MAG TPA: twin-arginine translocation signal domain-containing protein, partial [Ktedonobacteraceae bacterium]|nr:twin-arginine translocation signal domain-containing protein [Ktedonobacteraceae bacterium]
MNSLSRRQFLLLLGAGAVMVGGGAALTIRQIAANAQGNALKFKAISALPAKPMPGYASYVIDGQVNLNNTGTITKNVFAGPPEEITT